MTLVEQRDLEAQRTRDRAVVAYLLRFPAGSTAPATADRYIYDGARTLEQWRAVRQAPVVRRGGQ